MIRIRKPAAPPVLRRRGPRATRALCAAFDTGTRTFTFDATLYGAPSVKKALRKAQHNKCAFCESKFAHVGYGDVEHLRPKGGFEQRPEDPLTQPGYYWLAYEWANLFYSCQLCNQRFKKNLFPLRDPGKRATSHHHDIRAEEPLLLDPAGDPSPHISFRKEIAFPLKNSRQGRTTIDVVGLNREELVEVRRDRLATFRLLLQIRAEYAKRTTDPGCPARIRAQLGKLNSQIDALIGDNAEYAAMMRATLVGVR